jgi:hypothetical protein
MAGRTARGVRAVSLRARRRIGVTVAELMVAHVGQLKRFPRLPRTFTVRPATQEDAPALDEFSCEPQKIARLLSSGDLGMVAVSDGRIHAMEWIHFGPHPYDWDAAELGLIFRIPPRFCWLHNGSGTGMGPWGMVLGSLPDLLEQRGIETACLQVATENLYSIRCHESIGFRRVGRVETLRVGQQPLVWLRTNGTRALRFSEVTIDLDRLTE